VSITLRVFASAVSLMRRNSSRSFGLMLPSALTLWIARCEAARDSSRSLMLLSIFVLQYVR